MMSIIAACFILVVFNIKQYWFRLLIILSITIGLGITLFHIGVEQKWFPMPNSCISENKIASTNPSDILKSLSDHAKNGPMPRCDAITWRIFGIASSIWTMLVFAFALALSNIREYLFRKNRY